METQVKEKISQFTDDHVSALIMWILSDGRAYTAIELTDYTDASSQEVTTKLEKLKQTGLIVPENHRHHYFRLKSNEVSEAVGSLLYTELKGKEKRYNDEDELPDLKYCRSCHGHLAGKVGVTIAQKMQEEKLLIRQRVSAKYEFLLTDKGESFFKELGIETDALQKKGGTFAKACLDFSERKHHVGGKLGVAFLKKMVEKGW
ncbi:MAG TPA: hypothetical protein VK112_08925, partial [Fodinibius sp.]|nr:hypothetical protein [Fodinibius sp.]